MLMNKWFFRFIDMARTVSLWSKDRSKVGAVIVRDDKTIASVGFNGLPPGMDDDRHLQDRAWKNRCILHAEENAVLSATDAHLTGSKIYVWGIIPCGHCASVLSRKGIKTVFACSATSSDNPEWVAACEVGKTVFKECDIDFHYYSLEEYDAMVKEFAEHESQH